MITRHRAPECLLEADLQEDPQVPGVVELWPQQEHAVQDQHGVGWGDPSWAAAGLVGSDVEGGGAVAAAAPGPSGSNRLARRAG
jgi:hypothetical protein